MARLPQPGGDAGNWGEILNEFLEQAHEDDGSLKEVPKNKLASEVQDSLDKADNAIQDLSDLSITATPAELNTLEGITASTSELNHTDGVTSAIQPQLDGKVTGPPSAFDNAITRFDATTGKLIQNSGVYINDSGFVGIKTSSPTKELDVNSGSATGSISVGADVNATSLTANTRKIGRIVGKTYAGVGDDNNVFILGVDSQASAHSISFGGIASGTPYAAQIINFFTGSTTTTTGGTQRMYINNTGRIGIGDSFNGNGNARVAIRESSLQHIRMEYDASNLTSMTVDSGGKLTIDSTGTSPGIALNDSLSVTGDIAVSGTVDGRDVAADATKIENYGMGAVVHGATAGTARPTGFAVITWIGSVAPTNAIANDIWVYKA